MAKIVIIGANSYIARNFYVKLNEKSGLEVLLYDYQNNHMDNANNYIKIDVLDVESLKKIDFSCDLIYIFAGVTGTTNGFESYKTFIEINEIGLLNILTEYINQKSVAKIVFPSTRLLYKGKSGRLVEDGEKEFKTIYAINKFACERYLEMYSKVFNINYLILRICVPYGTMIQNVTSYGTADFFDAKGRKGEDIIIYGEGSQKRTLIHIEDLCEILWLAGINMKCINDVYNIGGDKELSIFEIAKTFADIYNVKVLSIEWPIVAQKLESWDTVFDSTKLDSILGFCYKHNFIQWAKDNKAISVLK